MSIIYVLIPLAILIVAIAIIVFFWAVKSDQFNDLDRQGYNILFDEDIKQGHPPKEGSAPENMNKNQATKENASSESSSSENSPKNSGNGNKENPQQQPSSSNHAR